MMANLNHFELSRILEARVQPRGSSAQFGGFGLEAILLDARNQLPVAGDASRSIVDADEDVQIQVAKIFESIREGAPTDALLFDETLRSRFAKECQEEGIELSSSQCRKVIFRIRKASNPPFKLSKAEYRISTPQEAKDQLPVIESAVARIKYTTAQSIDEIFIRDDLRDRFAGIVSRLSPTLSLRDSIQGALYLRKGVRKEVKQLIEPLDVSRLTSSVRSELVHDSMGKDVPPEEGFFEVRVPEASVYAGWNRNLRDVCNLFVRHETFDVITGSLWDIPHSALELRYFAGSELDSIPTSAWATKFVMERSPIFNVRLAA